MTLGTIDLTQHEAALLSSINFDWQSYDDLVRSCVASAKLMPLLLERDAMSERRLLYFTDPERNGGRKSRLQRYEENGTTGAEIFEHGGFLKYLKYFVHGSSLPATLKTDIAKMVGDPSYFSGEDIEPVRKKLGHMLVLPAARAPRLMIS